MSKIFTGVILIILVEWFFCWLLSPLSTMEVILVPLFALAVIAEYLASIEEEE